MRNTRKHRKWQFGLFREVVQLPATSRNVPPETENHGIPGSNPGPPTAFKPLTVIDRDLTVTGANNEKQPETEFSLSKAFSNFHEQT